VRARLAARIERSRYLPERLQALIVEQTIMIDTSGEAVGQINGLEVMVADGERLRQAGAHHARAFAGTAGVVNIDREVELGGPIHSKSVLILNGYIGGKYGGRRPLSLSASVVFEQTYQPVEGDSASLAELYTVRPTQAGAPLRQWLAVTGSMNQHGQVQAIGGINEKIEGFFDVCSALRSDRRAGGRLFRRQHRQPDAARECRASDRRQPLCPLPDRHRRRGHRTVHRHSRRDRRRGRRLPVGFSPRARGGAAGGVGSGGTGARARTMRTTQRRTREPTPTRRFALVDDDRCAVRQLPSGRTIRFPTSA
jgi:hypothetical protein